MRPDDDMKLGKLVKKRGFRQDAVIGRDFVIVEWYASLRELVDGLMKNAFAGVEYSVPAVAGSTAALLVMNVWPIVAIFITEGTTQLLYSVCVILLILIFWVVNNGRLGYVIAYPAAALLFTYIMWRSAIRAVTKGTVAWRGTAAPRAGIAGEPPMWELPCDASGGGGKRADNARAGGRCA